MLGDASVDCFGLTPGYGIGLIMALSDARPFHW